MQWLAPEWLAAAAAVLVPIVLHLRDRKPPDLIRVGSIADLDPSPAAQRGRRIDDVPLLLARCVVVILAALLLAGPLLPMRSGAGQRVAVVPATMDLLADSLRRVGVRVADVQPSLRPWSLLSWADTAAQPSDTLVMIAPARGALYTGTRPIVRHRVEVVTVEGAVDRADTTTIAVVAAAPRWKPQRDSVVRLLEAVAPQVPLLIATGRGVPDTIHVGVSETFGVDSLSLAAGALGRVDFIDTLVARLIPPPAVAPSAAELSPRAASGTATPPLRDGGPVAWWLLVGAIVVERAVAARRRW